MKLGLKIILPILLLLIIILGSFGYLLYNLKQQEAVISTQTVKIQKLNSLNERLDRQQEQTDYNVLAYRFNQDRSFLLVISQAELGKSKTLDEMYPYITSSRGKELITNYIAARKGVESVRNDLIIAIDVGDKNQIDLVYNRWSIQTQNIQAVLSDIKAYNINSLETTLATFKNIRDEITQVIILLSFAVIAAVILLYFYLRAIITQPIIRLVTFADQLANADFTTTIDSNSQDEIGMLSSSFNTMSTRLKEYYGELEQKVEEKTKELSRKVLDLEDSKKAMMNLLEDLEESKKLLEKKINESERLNKVMIGRELRVIELKKKVKELGGKLDD